MVPPEISQLVIVPFSNETAVFDKVAVSIVADVIVPAVIVEFAIVAFCIVEPSILRSVIALTGALPRNGIIQAPANRSNPFLQLQPLIRHTNYRQHQILY